MREGEGGKCELEGRSLGGWWLMGGRREYPLSLFEGFRGKSGTRLGEGWVPEGPRPGKRAGRESENS